MTTALGTIPSFVRHFLHHIVLVRHRLQYPPSPRSMWRRHYGTFLGDG